MEKLKKFYAIQHTEHGGVHYRKEYDTGSTVKREAIREARRIAKDYPDDAVRVVEVWYDPDDGMVDIEYPPEGIAVVQQSWIDRQNDAGYCYKVYEGDEDETPMEYWTLRHAYQSVGDPCEPIRIMRCDPHGKPVWRTPITYRPGIGWKAEDPEAVKLWRAFDDPTRDVWDV